MTTKKQRNQGIVILTAMTFFVPVLVGYRAHACPKAVRKKVLTLNKRAMDDFDLLRFKAARRKLLDAESVALANRCHKHRVAAKTYMNLAALYIRGFNDKKLGKLMFRRALKISKKIAPDPRVASPKLLLIFHRVKGSPTLPTTRGARMASRYKVASGEDDDALPRKGRRAKAKTSRRPRKPVRFRLIHREFARKRSGWSLRRSPAARLRSRTLKRLLADARTQLRKRKVNAAYRIFKKAAGMAPRDVKLQVEWTLIQARAGDVKGAMKSLKWLEDRISQPRYQSVYLKVVKLANAF